MLSKLAPQLPLNRPTGWAAERIVMILVKSLWAVETCSQIVHNDKRTNEQTNGRTSEQTTSRTDERMYERTHERANEPTNERTNGRLNVGKVFWGKMFLRKMFEGKRSS